ncbi:MAG: hypothetical protein LKI24_03375 [Acidipropionibacterium sp.]|jgi:hypothetical protein|nr:hypothetical protein [Acidipropionibacterium sp.]
MTRHSQTAQQTLQRVTRSRQAGLMAFLLPVLSGLRPPARRRDERGLSQSTENAILLVGAVAVATIVITAVTAYVNLHMPR